MLLTRLEREAVRGPAFGILRQSDQATGHSALERVRACEEGGVRSTVAKRDTEASGVTERDVGAPFAGRLEKRQGEEVGSAHDVAAEVVRAFGDRLPVSHLAANVGVLQTS